jgi:tetratricopeptide (TPR) repeat protein
LTRCVSAVLFFLFYFILFYFIFFFFFFFFFFQMRPFSMRLVGSRFASSGDAGKKLQARDPVAAAESFHRARVACHAAQDKDGEAEAVFGLAKCLKAIGNSAAYVSHLKEYLALVDPKPDRKAHVNYELGYSFFVAGDYADAIPYLQTARLNARLADNKSLEAWSLTYLGLVYSRRGEPVRAVQLMQRGVNLLHEAGDANGERRLLLMTAAVQHELGLLDDALASYSNATTLARKANDIKNEGKIYRLVGGLLQDKGDQQSALHSFKVAVQLSAASGDQLGLISSSLLVGNAISATKPLSAEAVPYWKEALRGCKAFQVNDVKKLLPLHSQALFRLISHYEGLHLYSVALPFRLELMQLMRSSGLQLGYATALQAVADLQARLGQLADAATSYSEAATLWKAFPDEKVNEGAARAGLASVLLEQGLVHDAKAEVETATALLEASTDGKAGKRLTMARARALAAAADVLTRTGGADRAFVLAQRSLNMSETSDQDIACMARLVLARCGLEDRSIESIEEARKLATKGLNHAISNQLFPQIYQGLNLLADISMLLNKREKAAEYFEKMISLADDKKVGSSWRGSAMQKLAELKENAGDFAAAEKLHREAVPLLTGQLSKTFKSLISLVRIYEKLGNHEAAASFSRMIKHVKEDNKKD